jgi:UDP-N-acetylglucosamine--N-acetylmuramyl-(pentapeptide) pyrophosphoryl-undecaprenol N-acetylglucosamine transferase
MDDRERLAAMAASARSAGSPDAAVLLADLAEAIAGGGGITKFRENRPQ